MKSLALRSLLIACALFCAPQLYSQSVFDKFESFLVSRKLQLSYGIQASWYKESDLHYVQPQYERDLIIHDVSAIDRDYLDALGRGEVGVVQFSVNAELELSSNYSLSFSALHIGYHVNVDQKYYQLGTWNGDFVTRIDKMSEQFKSLEHSNGINLCNIGLLRRIKLTKDESKKVSFELGIRPNVGLLFSATQGEVYNPSGDIEKYDPGNELAGYNYGLEGVARMYIKKHYFIGANINYFLMQLNQAQLQDDAFVEQQIRGYNYGINVGYKF